MLADVPEVTTGVHPRVGVGLDPCVVLFHGLGIGVTIAVAAAGRQGGEDEGPAPLRVLKSASFPRPEVGAIKSERSGVGTRVSMRRMACTLDSFHIR